MTPNKKCVEEAVEKSLIRPSNAEMSEIPDVSRDYILALEDECNVLRDLAQSYLSGELGVMASDGELRVIISTILQENMRDKKKITETISRLAKALVGKIASVGRVEEPRGAQFRRVEEQQKMIERYRLALEKIMESCNRHSRCCMGESNALNTIIYIATNALYYITSEVKVKELK